ncbi:MAG TPA: flagellar FliJ family protein [Syntrophorhabdales bacterium]|nr:flagellar FliJ family protein [Syntrophorhabdales bacterium]
MHSGRLLRIIELKERLMEEKERLLDQHSRERDKILSNIGVIDTEIESNYGELCSRCLDGNEFASIKEYLEHLARLKTAALNQKELIERQIAAIRSELYEMFKEIKVLHALNEKRLSAARRAENKKYQKLLDEIALRLETQKR